MVTRIPSAGWIKSRHSIPGEMHRKNPILASTPATSRKSPEVGAVGSSEFAVSREAIRSLTREELLDRFRSWQQPQYRADQVLHWIYDRQVADWQAMTNIPLALRNRLRETFDVRPLSLVRQTGSRDATRKFLWRLNDGALIESVLIPASPALYGEPSDRLTLCVSTQVGCAYGCRFCASGLEGWKRNLSVDEIVDQWLAAERHVAGEIPDQGGRRYRRVHNLVIMGMGEPLANYDALMKALKILNSSWGGGIGARKITVSTSGLAPRIRQLAGEPLQVRLALSLHGGTDEVRERIMPVNRKYPLAELVAACEEFNRSRGQKITLEYVLIEGVNDGLDQVAPLADMAHRLRAKVNLIPYNTVPGLEWRRPSDAVQETFLEGLATRGVSATLRREKGHDIDAACGQLRLRTEKEFNKS